MKEKIATHPKMMTTRRTLWMVKTREKRRDDVIEMAAVVFP